MNSGENAFYELFASRLRQLLQKAGPDLKKLQEIRLRAGRPILLQYDGKEYGLTKDGTLTEAASQGICVSRAELDETLEYISGYSLYAFDEEMKQGFLTVPGGHRIGVAGRIVMEGGSVRCIRHISCINIRLSHEIIGCADGVMGHLVSDRTLCHTLIVSPPRCGKTTLLRDLIRKVSDGTEWLAGMTVGVVDERCELAGSYLGEAQNDLGMRTDVLEGAPKAEGMMMLLRSMSPQVIAVDEIGSGEDSYALENVFHCGCRLIATAHGTSLEDIRKRPLLRRMTEEQLFDRYLILEGNPAGSVREILDGQGNCLYRRGRADHIRHSGNESKHERENENENEIEIEHTVGDVLIRKAEESADEDHSQSSRNVLHSDSLHTDGACAGTAHETAQAAFSGNAGDDDFS